MHQLQHVSGDRVRFRLFATVYEIEPGEVLEVASDKVRRGIIANALAKGAIVEDLQPPSKEELLAEAKLQARAEHHAELAELEAENNRLEREKAELRAELRSRGEDPEVARLRAEVDRLKAVDPPAPADAGDEPETLESAPPPVVKRRSARKKPAKKKK